MPRLAPLLLALALAPGLAQAQQAAIFDGDGDWIDLGVLDPGPEFTVETWVRFDAVTDWQTVFEVVELPSGLNAFYVGYNLGNWQVELGDTTVYEGDTCGTPQAVCFTSTVSPLTPHHLAVTRSANELAFYVNGNLLMSWPSPPDPGFGTQSWVLGADTDTGTAFLSDPLDGYLAEVRIWDSARTQTELLTTMNYGLTGFEPGLYALWAMDEPTGSPTAPDLSGNGQTAVLMEDTDFAPSPFWVTASSGGDIPGFDFDSDGYTPADGDCDDTDDTVFPGGAESCDATDSNCDGDLVDGDPDVDGDGLPDCIDGDNDNDGDPDGSDCAPLDPTIYAGAPELCDAIDSNCDGDLVDGDPDVDGDGLPDCVDDDNDNDGDPDATDCAPLDPTVYTGAIELCDAIDSNCDGEMVDGFGDLDGDLTPDCVDPDDDGDGDPDATDCAPTNGAVYAGAPELCDAIDSDCDGDLVDGFDDVDADGLPDCDDPDDDGDGDPDATDCAPADPTIYTGAAEVCDAIDSDCDGDLADNFDDLDADGEPDCVDADDDGDVFPDSVDCGPLDATIYPGAVEACDAIDSDCDGDLVDGFEDADGDGLPACIDDDDTPGDDDDSAGDDDDSAGDDDDATGDDDDATGDDDDATGDDDDSTGDDDDAGDDDDSAPIVPGSAPECGCSATPRSPSSAALLGLLALALRRRRGQSRATSSIRRPRP